VQIRFLQVRKVIISILQAVSWQFLFYDFSYKRSHFFSFRIAETQAQSAQDDSNGDIEGFREVAIIGSRQNDAVTFGATKAALEKPMKTMP
jgi:hypothetical protein